MYWKLAVAQHPMYLLIKEDTGCAERTPPWGTPSIELYIDRLRNNIKTLHKYPQLKIGYEWSGLELEQLKEDAPDVFAAMLDLVHAGQATFYNGTYAQPHLQTLSSESNYRQFEWGTRVYRTLCGGRSVSVYAHQESSINEQTPQLLKAFGIRFVVMPNFSSTLVILDGGELTYHARYGTMFMQGEEFARWRGLDGTFVNLYLNEPKHGTAIQDWLAYQDIIGLTHVPPVTVEIPDMVDMNDEWIQNRARAEFALLDEVLEERYTAFPPRFHVRFFSNWSYIEGIRAEELSRLNWKAELNALRSEALNSLAFVLLRKTPESSDPIWRKILTTQHHDVYCFCAPMLRDKSVALLQEASVMGNQMATNAALAIASKIDTSGIKGQPLVVFNTVPHTQSTVVTAEVDQPNPIVFEDGLALPCESTPKASGKWLVRFHARLSGLGYATFQVQTGSQKMTSEAPQGDFTFENPFYQATVNRDGTFASLILRPSQEELLEGDDNPGNQITGWDTSDIEPGLEGETSKRGQEMEWQVDRRGLVIRSPLGAAFTVSGVMGAKVKATLTIHFYHILPRIDCDWIFTFNQSSIGRFFDDDTKLCLLWPLSFKGNINHDIAFGVVEAREERPFFPTSWVDISDGQKGFAYFHQGTLKHWVFNKMLVNLFAWGEDTDRIGNRMDLSRWPKRFDQRLGGTHAIHSAIFPHEGSWRSSDVINAALGYGAPPVACTTSAHAGPLPNHLSILQIDHPELVGTAVNVMDGKLMCRLYSVSQQTQSMDFTTNHLTLDHTTRIDGTASTSLDPFQIGAAYFQPK